MLLRGFHNAVLARRQLDKDVAVLAAVVDGERDAVGVGEIAVDLGIAVLVGEREHGEGGQVGSLAFNVARLMR